VNEIINALHIFLFLGQQLNCGPPRPKNIRGKTNCKALIVLMDCFTYLLIAKGSIYNSVSDSHVDILDFFTFYWLYN
jgi:hypothetical protein